MNSSIMTLGRELTGVTVTVPPPVTPPHEHARWYSAKLRQFRAYVGRTGTTLVVAIAEAFDTVTVLIVRRRISMD